MANTTVRIRSPVLTTERTSVHDPPDFPEGVLVECSRNCGVAMQLYHDLGVYAHTRTQEFCEVVNNFERNKETRNREKRGSRRNFITF